MARTDGVWEIDPSGYIKPIGVDGYDILVFGSNRYINFNTLSGSSGYGFRDNAGTIEFKNSGGTWTGIGSGSGSSWGLTGNASTTYGTNYIGTSDATNLSIKTNAVQRIKVTTGLNTNSPITEISSPQADLNSNPMNSMYLRLGGLEYGVNTYRTIGFGYSGGGAPAYFGYQEKSSSSNTYGDLVRGTQATGGTPSERMRLFSDGNLSLGTTTNAGYKLDVNGTTRIADTFYVGSSSSDGVNITRAASGQGLITSWAYTPSDPTSGISIGANFGFNGASNNFYGMGLGSLRNSAYDIWFQTGVQNGGGYRWYIGTSEKMTMFKNGNVAIDTTTDAGFKCDINGTLRVQNALTLGNLASDPTGSNGMVYYNTTTNKFKSYQNGAWIDLIDSDIYNISLEFMSGLLTVDFYAPYAMKIDTVTDVKNTPTTTILVNGSAYTLGTAITLGSLITVTVSTASVVRFNCTK